MIIFMITFMITFITVVMIITAIVIYDCYDNNFDYVMIIPYIRYIYDYI